LIELVHDSIDRFALLSDDDEDHGHPLAYLRDVHKLNAKLSHSHDQLVGIKQPEGVDVRENREVLASQDEYHPENRNNQAEHQTHLKHINDDDGKAAISRFFGLFSGIIYVFD
jgi:hypothetical protein